jgi:hypothetical protein
MLTDRRYRQTNPAVVACQILVYDKSRIFRLPSSLPPADGKVPRPHLATGRFELEYFDHKMGSVVDKPNTSTPASQVCGATVVSTEPYWNPLRRELEAWLRRYSPDVVEIYRGSLKILFDPAFSGQIAVRCARGARDKKSRS